MGTGSPESAEVDSQQEPVSLREQQRMLTRDRIVSALAALIESGHPLDVTMAAVAEQAGVSEPTLYRHFPNKRTLFEALGSDLYRKTTADVAPTNLDELLDVLPAVYERFAEMEATVRWNLAAPKDDTVRPAAAERLPILRDALAGVLDDLPPDEAELLLRGVLLLTAPTSMLYWQDYLGVTVDEAAETASWLIGKLAGR
jgi:AcrR family transcriptional regulator